MSNCDCVICATCNGSGHFWRCENGDIFPMRCDDMGELINCEECRGSGISEECPSCFGVDNDDDWDLYLGGT